MHRLISHLDCQRFGFKIAKINSWDIDVNDTIHQLRNESVKLIIARVNNKDLAIINSLEEYGFRLKDIQITYQCKIDQSCLENFQQNSNFVIREADTNDIPAVSSIAYASFLNYGHYFADARLDKERCGEIYQDWIRNCCIDKNFADIVLVATINSNVVGFVAFKIYNSEGKKYASAAISAVAENYRGKGIYKALIRKSLVWCLENQCKWQEHNILAINYPVSHALCKLGFTVVNAFMTFHYWLDE
ncbi:MAG TPA: GNAT family N-acetyltransferase [Gammaproteobacteria bacterium]|nr:GNAT family N-acetyltransferase [Gammaproteobacteria bacterium]